MTNDRVLCTAMTNDQDRGHLSFVMSWRSAQSFVMELK